MNGHFLAFTTLFAFLLCCSAQASPTAVRIDLVTMGGDDCLPCIAWRKGELPRLMQKPEFALIRHHHIDKKVRQSVPAASLFPPGSAHLQPSLEKASGGLTGSPHQALLLDGKVVDYWMGTDRGTAEALAEMIRALHTGGFLPRPVCQEWVSRRECRQWR